MDTSLLQKAQMPATTSVYIEKDGAITCEGNTVKIGDDSEYAVTKCHVKAPLSEIYTTDLQRLVDSAMSGIDGVFLLLGLTGSSQWRIFQEADGLVVSTISNLVSILSERQRTRTELGKIKAGSSETERYTFSVKIRIVEAVGERMRDLVSQPQRASGDGFCNAIETDQGLTLSGPQSLMIDSPEAQADVIHKVVRAMTRCNEATVEDATVAVWVDVFQRDNMLNWATTRFDLLYRQRRSCG
ncbi:hypothetical protein FOL47_007253 [Perkinsus chesapeaki]|uniref:Uncharacterized protein n=1 Tax=Perkinsus chesapeaki TaxID=330153 RepID=A0A7J6LLS2_PERCH|nr:hypothetical protein FOL47_007253 [Perkinsus chesapeaki]